MSREGSNILRGFSDLLIIASLIVSRDYYAGNLVIVEWLEYLMYIGFVVAYGLNILDRGAGWVRVGIETVAQLFLFYSVLNSDNIYMALGFVLTMFVVMLVPVNVKERKKSTYKVDEYLISNDREVV